MTKSTLYPQFFRTLLPEFHTNLTIPVDFFSKYIQGSGGNETAKLKSDASDITWQVKMTGRRLGAGWEEFAVAHDLQIGNVVVVRYEGDMVFHVSDLGPNSCEIRDIPAPSSNNYHCDQNNIDNPLLKKNLHPRTEADDGYGGDNQDNIELPRKKKVKKNNPGTEADNSSFVALVTALNLRTDTLYLPQHFTSSNGLTRKCGEIVLTDEGERSWTLNLRFSKPSDTFYISPGWRNFCEENGEKVGGFFMFKLVENGETPVLSFCHTESINDRTRREYSEASGRKPLSAEHNREEENIEEKSSGDEPRELLMEIEKKKYSPRRTYSSYSPITRFVTFTLPPDYVRIGKLSLPTQFIKENGIPKPGEIHLLGKDGTKQLVNLGLDKKGTMSLGKGWKDFVKANGLEKGFTLKLIWEDTTPVLSLCCADSSSDRGQEEFPKAIEKQSLSTDPTNIGKISKDENNKESSSWEREKNHMRWRYSTPSCQKNIVTLTITPLSFRKCRLRLPTKFTRENDISKPGMITLQGKDGIKQQTKLLLDKVKGVMALGNGWKDFVEANGLKMGDSFTLKLIWEDTTPVLSLCRGGECLEASAKESLPIEPSNRKKIIKDDKSKEESSSGEREKNDLRWRESTSPNQSRFVTLTPTHDSLRNGRLCLPKQFMRENSINESGMITLSGKDGTKWLTPLRVDKHGTIRLGKGWKEFAEANGLKVGQSFTLESIWEDATHVLSLCRGGVCLEASAKESLPIEPSSRKKIIEDDKSKEESSSGEREKNDLRWRESTSPNQSRFVTLTPTHDSLRNGRLCLPKQFMRENSINESGMITLSGKDGTKWLTPLRVDKHGTIRLGKGWKEFAEANGLKVGQSFTLESIWEDATHVLSLCRGGECLEASAKESLPIELSNRKKIIKDDKSKEESSSGEREKNDLRWRESTSPNQSRFVTLTPTHDSLRNGRLCLPKQFMRENSINESGMITLSGKDGTKWLTPLRVDKHGTIRLGKGWKEFAEANGLKVGQSFTLESIWEDATHVLSLCRGGECLEASAKESLPIELSNRKKIIKDDKSKEESSSGEREKNDLRWRESTSPNQSRFVTLTPTHDSLRNGRLCLPKQFMRENSMNECEMITLSGKDGTKWLTTLLVDKHGTIRLGKGWKEFAEANGLKVGQSFTLESIWEDGTPMLSLFCRETSCDKKQQDECPKASEKESISTEGRRGDSSSVIQNRFVTLTLSPEDVTACKLNLPSQFMRANGINKLGKITLLGKNGLEWLAYLLSKDGIVALGCGWKDFCEANGVKTGETFTLEFLYEKDSNLVLKFCSKSRDKYINVTN